MSLSPESTAHRTQAPAAPPPWPGRPVRCAGAAAAGLGIALVAVVVLANAWLCDDAYIVLRIVDNFVHGYGLRWNTADRVQVFTCPLWTLLLAVPYAATGEAYFTTLVSGFVLAMAGAVVVLFRAASGAPAAVFAAVAMATSKAFVDFSTSGLENPLSHLLLVAFFVLLLGRGPAPGGARRTLALSLLASLAIVNRMDLALIVLPPLTCHTVLPRTRAAVAWAALGQAPLAAWLAFSLAYYGFFLPNTAYAKLAADFSRAQLADRGLLYLADSLRTDPVSLGVVVLGVAAGIAGAARSRAVLPAAAALGVALYPVYTVLIGGDFMSGRFVAAPFVAGLTLLLLTARAGMLNPPAWGWRAGVLAACAAGLLMPAGPLKVPVGASPARIWRDLHERRGICDERTFYARSFALARLVYGLPVADHQGFHDGRVCRGDFPEGSVFVAHCAGTFGYAVGPRHHLVDHYALGDPLLARLPPYYRSIFRPGHLARMIPPGYIATLRTGRSEIEDPGLARYHAHLSLITRGPLFSRERWRAIAAMQTGRLDGLFEPDRFREPARSRWPEGLPLPWREPVPVPTGSDLGTPDARIVPRMIWVPGVGRWGAAGP